MFVNLIYLKQRVVLLGTVMGRIIPRSLRHIIEWNRHLDLLQIILSNDAGWQLFKLVLVEPESYLQAFLRQAGLSLVVDQFLSELL